MPPKKKGAAAEPEAADLTPEQQETLRMHETLKRKAFEAGVRVLCCSRERVLCMAAIVCFVSSAPPFSHGSHALGRPITTGHRRARRHRAQGAGAVKGCAE